MTAAIAVAILQLQGQPGATGALAVGARLLAVVIAEEAARFDVDPFIVAAVIAKESGFNRKAQGKRGDLGLMQIRRGGAVPASLAHLSDTALMYPRANVHIGTRYLAKMIAVCKGDVAAGLSRYNGGRCRVSRYGRDVLRLARSVQQPKGGNV